MRGVSGQRSDTDSPPHFLKACLDKLRKKKEKSELQDTSIDTDVYEENMKKLFDIKLLKNYQDGAGQ